MPDMSYNTETLREGARGTRNAADAATDAGSTVAGTPVSAGPFGNVGPAGSLSGALGDAQQQHSRGANDAAANRDTKAVRIDRTAETGDELVVVTTTAANNGVSQGVADGME